MQCQGLRHHHFDIHIVLIIAEVYHLHSHRSGGRDGARLILRHCQQIRGGAVVAHRHILVGGQIRNSVSTIVRAGCRHGDVHRRDGRQLVVHRVDGSRGLIRDAVVTLVDGQRHLVGVAGAVTGDIQHGSIASQPVLGVIAFHRPTVSESTRQVHQLGSERVILIIGPRTSISGHIIDDRLQNGLRGIHRDGIVGDVIDSVSHHGKIRGKQRGVVRRSVGAASRRGGRDGTCCDSIITLKSRRYTHVRIVSHRRNQRRTIVRFAVGHRHRHRFRRNGHRVNTIGCGISRQGSGQTHEQRTVKDIRNGWHGTCRCSPSRIVRGGLVGKLR